MDPAAQSPTLAVNNVSSMTRRQGLPRITWAWALGSVWLFIVTGAVMVRLGKLLALPEWGFGLLGAVPHLAALVELPVSVVLERYGNRKSVFLIAAVVHRSLWVGIAALPWLFEPPVGWILLIGVCLVSHFLGRGAGPAWISWMADYIPSRVRGRYLARRSQVSKLVGILTTLLVGFVLDWATEAGTLQLQEVLTLLLSIAGILGVADILLFIRIPDAGPKKKGSPLSWRTVVQTPMRNREFRLILGYWATITFATVSIGQYVWLYLLDVLGLSNLQASVLLVGVPLLIQIAILPYWGRIIDRVGAKQSQLWAGLLVVPGAVAWLGFWPQVWYLGYILVVISVLGWSGMFQCQMNLLMGFSGSRRGNRAGSAYVATASLVGALAGTVGGLAGAALADCLQHWHGSLFGLPLSYHSLLFIGSSALRALALVWLVLLVRSSSSDRAMARRHV